MDKGSGQNISIKMHITFSYIIYTCIYNIPKTVNIWIGGINGKNNFWNTVFFIRYLRGTVFILLMGLRWVTLNRS